ncbi:MAG: hypothetical protein HY326_04610 [Chloroflexi bacterium]|nr:hypothetical protein [Chloroflexota bacterium]
MQHPKHGLNEQDDPTNKRDLISLIRWRLFFGILTLLAVGIVFSFIGFSDLVVLLTRFIVFDNPLAEEYWRRFFQELGIAFLVTAIITGVAQLFLIANSEKLKDRLNFFIESQVITSLKKIDETAEISRDDLDRAVKALERIEKNLQKQTEELIQTVASLEAMRQSGIVRIYASRASASEDIKRDLIAPNVTQIRLMGISLNDFVLAAQPNLNNAWKTIEQYIRSDKHLDNPKKGLDIRVMVIDPDCLGAQLRSQGEERERVAVAGRLKTDVTSTAQHLFRLQKIAKANESETGVKFEFRLYRVPPIMFLCRTDVVSYVQQYHFWRSRATDVPIPIIRYRGLAESTWDHSMHEETKIHFDWIWDQASISAEEFLLEKAVGIDRGMHSVGAVNVFNDLSEARERLLWLTKNAKKRLYIQGISLKSFFDQGDLFAAISDLVDVDIKILLLNPDSEQAYYRSFREYLFVKPKITFEEFRKNPQLHSESGLSIDTKKSISQIRNVFGSRNNGNFHVKTYDSAPACFLFIADDSALVEQYHYGKILPEKDRSGFPVLLGKDSPLVEYVDQPSDLFESNSLRCPFRLMLNHFNFVFDSCTKPVDLHQEKSVMD